MRAGGQAEGRGNRLKLRIAAYTCGVVVLTAGANDFTPAQSLNWSDSITARREALALLETLNADLLSNNSATATLEHWCDVHHLAVPPQIVADRILDIDKPASAEQRRELRVSPTELVRYRRVKLRCGAVVLSEADNWYVPGRLTPEMNKLLDSSDTPFGKAVQSLHFQRRTLSSRVLWMPADVPMPADLLEHRALLSLPDGTPFSEVVETYTANVLGFPVPRR
jgi:chorismate-pyruvate lyase